MKRLIFMYKKILLICIVFSFSLGGLVNWATTKLKYTNSLMDNSYTARMTFLNNTFCGKFINGTWKETVREDQIKQRQQFLQDRNDNSNIHYSNISCLKFISKNGFYSKHITAMEQANPMAFGILVYGHYYQFQVLMRTLYVRTNFHCIHVDRKAPEHFYTYALKLSTCLENVHLVNTRIDVKWGDRSVLEAQSLCQRLLLNQSSSWHYYMTIAGTELPIQANLNRLQILQLAPDKFRVDVTSSQHPFYLEKLDKSLPPRDMSIYKGEFHAILTRHFIEAVHRQPLALQLYDYLNGMPIADEFFYSSLVRRHDFPGAETRLVQSYTYKKLLSHYKSWFGQSSDLCLSNRYVRTICQFAYHDLANIETSGRLFVNKFNEEHDLVGIDCWEQWLKMKEKHHQDIDPRKYIDRYPFTQISVKIEPTQVIDRNSEFKFDGNYFSNE